VECPAYDAAGNVTNDGNGNKPTYTVEDQIATDAGFTYYYDADGERMEKSSSSSGTMYWSGPGGETLAETNLSGTINEEYIYFDGERIARVDRPSGAVNYYFSNHLGSASVITSATGTIQEETDYYPFGGIAYQTGSDPNHYKFTGKERDSESGLDNFGARYFTSNLGRFMTPDWAARPTAVPYAVFGDPQSLNLYAYVRNDPVSRADADGHAVQALPLPGKGQVCMVPVGACDAIEQLEGYKDAQALQEGANQQVSTTQSANAPANQASDQQAQNTTYKSKDAAAEAAGREMRKKQNGYKWEYGARIHKDGKKYSYGPVVTDKDPKGVNLPDLQKNDVGDIHTHNYGADPQPNVMGQSDQQGTVRDMDAVRKMNGGAKADYSSYVLAPNGDLIKFTPDLSGPAGWGQPQVIKHDVAPDPNPQ
jgi:RHS repeat-associated protein